MTVRSLLAQGCDTLAVARVDTPVLDATLLLAHALGATKEKLLAALPDDVTEEAAESFHRMIERRRDGVPVSYIRGIKEFYGLTFRVDERVLVPRPDTEVLVDTALALAEAQPGIGRVLDACTGSGCIAVALAACAPRLEVHASDISADALVVANENALSLLGRGIPLHHCDLLDGVPGRFDMIVSNPPYLSTAEVDAMRAARWPEPTLALEGGVSGTEIAARLIAAAPGRLEPDGWLLLEAAPGELGSLGAAMTAAGFARIEVRQDLAGRDRVILGRLDGGGGHG